MSERFHVEVVFAESDKQILLDVVVEPGTTVAEVIAASGIEQRFDTENLDSFPVGIWGRVVDRGHEVQSGDRVEIYRPLVIDPRKARRQLAEAGRTMGRPDAARDGDGEEGDDSG